MNKNSSEKQEMLWQKGVNWNDHPPFFKRGSYVKRFTEERTLTSAELERIPEKHRPDPEVRFMRSTVKVLDMPPIRRVSNLKEVFMEQAIPIERTKNEENSSVDVSATLNSM